MAFHRQPVDFNSLFLSMWVIAIITQANDIHLVTMAYQGERFPLDASLTQWIIGMYHHAMSFRTIQLLFFHLTFLYQLIPW